MVKPELNATTAERIKGMVDLRDCVNELIALQMDEYSAESQIQNTKSETFSIEVNEPNICCFWSCISRCRIVHNSPYNSTVWDIVMCMTIIQVEILIRSSHSGISTTLPCTFGKCSDRYAQNESNTKGERDYNLKVLHS